MTKGVFAGGGYEYDEKGRWRPILWKLARKGGSWRLIRVREPKTDRYGRELGSGGYPIREKDLHFDASPRVGYRKREMKKLLVEEMRYKKVRLPKSVKYV